MADPLTWTCQTCDNVGLFDGSDGFFYCLRCGAQAEDIIDTGVADEDFVEKGNDAGGAIYLASNRRHRPMAPVKVEPLSQYSSLYESQSQFWQTLSLGEETPKPKDYHPHDYIKSEEYNMSQPYEVDPSVPLDFGGSVGAKVPSFDDYYNEIRIRYVMGLQLMIEFQCEVLVKEFNVNPLICGLVGSIWLRFVSGTDIFDDDWADLTIEDSEMQHQDEPEDYKQRAKYRAEPHNMEAVLPTDIMKWTLEGKLPYFSAFVEIEKRIGKPSSACPISSSVMFRPSQAVPLQKLESLAASIAHAIGLELPPVNFYAIAFRYLEKLSLPVEKILSHACRIYEWSMPPDLWLSTNDLRLPTRVCVMSILIVAIRILFNINGFGEWEKSLPFYGDPASKSTSVPVPRDTKSDENSLPVEKSELDCVELLHNLEARYKEMANTFDYSKDLSTYLQYCKDVVFAGLEPSYEDHEEEKMIEYLWNFYQNEKDSEQEEPREQSKVAFNQKRFRDEGYIRRASMEKKKRKGNLNKPSSDNETILADDPQQSLSSDQSSQSTQDDQDSDSNDNTSADTLNEEAIKQMKLDMEENRFCYIPPRFNVKRFDYLHYVRKKDEGALTYVAHADYYILLRACARVAQVDIRIMHIGVLSLERRLAWLENRIDHCLHLTPPTVCCEFCSDMVPENVHDDTLGLSNLRI
ncbi:TATA box-binding protein-associated factor RNA polymerase I subunit B [Quillaja saponaria]|uniref:TATA box-binding protein-associated factor RNA polymerase I subunit B n=1 Tax=Quillaja saponaria TaxID=32244 RepID=A0AAD7L8X3_QUISA|nr:TATA box-binding protein-associated factor RNA polymerase I subunit B [Quillaja saponaria]